MHKARILQAVVIAGFLVLAVSAYAANTITLNNPATVNGKQLAAGEYQVKVSANGDVTFLRGKAEVVTAKATLKDLDSKARFSSVVTKVKDGSMPSITEIQFEGKKQVLVFDNTSQASNDSSGGRQ
ncbi:MAG TPA: hypothetical protein VES66_00525 [Terriglobales bacterium]|nr:hypothetical protein [Terriglobales bacterium]